MDFMLNAKLTVTFNLLHLNYPEKPSKRPLASVTPTATSTISSSTDTTRKKTRPDSSVESVGFFHIFLILTYSD